MRAGVKAEQPKTVFKMHPGKATAKVEPVPPNPSTRNGREVWRDGW